MYEEIAKQVRQAALHNSKIGMFHFQVLKNASSLAGVDGVAFCKAIGVPESYAIEFRKMLKLAEIMQQQGVKIS